jgi:hypothetical protein
MNKKKIAEKMARKLKLIMAEHLIKNSLTERDVDILKMHPANLSQLIDMTYDALDTTAEFTLEAEDSDKYNEAMDYLFSELIYAWALLLQPELSEDDSDD